MRNKIKLMLVALFWVGYGIALHANANELWNKGGYTEILSFQGEWIGFTLMAVAWFAAFFVERRQKA